MNKDAIDGELVRVSVAEISRDMNKLRSVFPKGERDAELTGDQAEELHLMV